MKSNKICSKLRKGANFAAANLPLRPQKTTMTELAELGVLCMPASFVTYQTRRPQGLMQDCLRHWAESQYWCQKWDVNHSWLGSVLNLGLCHWMSRISQGCQAGEAPWTERRTVATCWFSRVRVGVSNRRWGPLAGPQ